MRERLIDRGIRPERIHVAENWADGNQIRPSPIPDKNPLTIVYSGTLALSHDVETIVSAMELLKDDPRFRFVFIGGGTARSKLEERSRAAGLTSTVFLPYRNRQDVGASLASGHIGLVTMKDQCVGTVVPSKVYGIMAARRPVLFIGPSCSSPAALVEKHRCGWQIDCGDVSGLIRLLEKLFVSRGLIQAAGGRAREAFERHYDVIQGVARISRILGAAIGLEESPSGTGREAAITGVLRKRSGAEI
jgi:glycosyltransferase involved in cell wall biosynthesis